MVSTRQELKERFGMGKTVPGTRSYHHYTPISTTEISYKRTSEHEFEQHFNLSKAVQVINDDAPLPNLNDFVACRYDTFWWVGMVDKIEGEKKDFKIKFMHPHGPSKRFSWPERDDSCWVPINNMIAVIGVPTTRSGRIYEIDIDDFNKVAAWTLKMRALTEQVYVDDLEADEEGIAEMFMDDNAIAQTARPGTSLKTARTPGTSSQAYRPVTQSGRPVTGVIRPNTQSARPKTMEQALRTARTAKTARPVTSTSGRYVRLGTASMLSNIDGPFINIARLNLTKYAADSAIVKPLFEYLYYHENDVKHALDLLNYAIKDSSSTGPKDWWLLLQVGKCYFRMGLFRDAQTYFQLSLKQQQMVDTYLCLAQVFKKLDQPSASLQIYTEGLTKFSAETSLLTGIARTHEALGDVNLAIKFYKDVLQYDAINVEAIACIATEHFYTDQPEIALRFYRRLLQMGICNAELYNNLGLCCFFAQQYDMSLVCFQRALSLSNDDVSADIWYNIGHLALNIGDSNLAYQSFRLALAANNEHAEAYNNLGVLEALSGNRNQAQAYLQSSNSIGPHLFEPLYNQARIYEEIGNIELSFSTIQKSMEIFPEHHDSKNLLQRLKNFLSAV
ncbi:Tetratricopeptide repeat protein 8 [Nymphon striatum]|nr:Tetratricopeptide repeat protein 8 [Nymphon striatum]